MSKPKNKLLELLRNVEISMEVFNDLENLKTHLRSTIINWDEDWAKEELKEALETWANE